MTSTASTMVNSVTSWWYGQGGAVEVVRRLEALHALAPAPPAPGLVTARRDGLTVTFVDALRTPLPQPWSPADTGSEARIGWGAVDPGAEPDPQHPVYLVVFGTTDDGALVAMNLAAFARIRIAGEQATTTALVSRWVLELLATHPDITIGITTDVWRGPLTTRVRDVHVGAVPLADVLICGPGLSYTDRAQIVSTATSRIIVDLGKDAAIDTKWTISCGQDRVGQITNGQSRPMVATLILPNDDTVERCCDLLTGSPTTCPTSDVPDHNPSLPVVATTDAATDADHANDLDAPYSGGIDFFEPHSASVPFADIAAELDHKDPWPASDAHQNEPAPALEVPAGAAAVLTGHTSTDAAAEAVPLPIVAPLWNRLLGQVVLCPPQLGQQPGPREKRINELLVFLQMNSWVNSSEIIRSIYGGAASEKTVTQQVSLLRARLGNVRPGGPKALPPMRDGEYHLDSAVRSDWMEFERLVEIRPEMTPPSHLIAAMGLVTGPPLGGITPKDWPWTKCLREQMRDRVPGAAVVLARHHYDSRKFNVAVEIARKGLWYDNARQDLWQVAMQAALDGHEHEAFKVLRRQYLNTVAGPDQDPAVLELTKQGL